MENVSQKSSYAKALGLVLALVLIAALAGCGGSTSKKSGPTAKKEPDSKITATEPRDDLQEKIKLAKSTAEAARKEIAAQGWANAEYADNGAQTKGGGDFRKGNTCWKDGKYQEALDAYEAVLKKYPWHYGSLNNATLACLELATAPGDVDNQKALQYALVALELYPDNPELLLNAQTAVVANNYSIDDLRSAYTATYVRAQQDPKLGDPVEYNDLYSRLIHNRLADQEASDELLSEVYTTAEDELKSLSDRSPSDHDYQALRKYLQGVGVLTGVVEKPTKPGKK